MYDHNMWPKDTKEVTGYQEILPFFTYQITTESRQPFYEPNNHLSGMMNLRIFWINKDLGIGYGVGDDWKHSRIVWYKFGSDVAWHGFVQNFCAQFNGDRS